MESERVISYERGRQLADQLGIEFFETSAKDNVNVKVSEYFMCYLDKTLGCDRFMRTLQMNKIFPFCYKREEIIQ